MTGMKVCERFWRKENLGLQDIETIADFRLPIAN
jgi:hypothetical protein